MIETLLLLDVRVRLEERRGPYQPTSSFAPYGAVDRVVEIDIYIYIYMDTYIHTD